MDAAKAIDQIDAPKILYSGNKAFYAVVGAKSRGFWASVETFPLPVPPDFRAIPRSHFALLIKGRDYWRQGNLMPIPAGEVVTCSAGDQLYRDYVDCAWWTPGLEEAWTEIKRLRGAKAS